MPSFFHRYPEKKKYLSKTRKKLELLEYLFYAGGVGALNPFLPYDMPAYRFEIGMLLLILGVFTKLGTGIYNCHLNHDYARLREDNLASRDPVEQIKNWENGADSVSKLECFLSITGSILTLAACIARQDIVGYIGLGFIAMAAIFKLAEYACEQKAMSIGENPSSQVPV